MEKTIERLLFASRWILAPVYLGLSLALVALGIKFFMELHLLRAFMETPGYVAKDRQSALMWYVIIHLTFVVSAVMMGVLDRITSSQHRGHKGEV